MPFDYKEELKHTFGLASLRHEASKKLNAEEWKKFQTITKKYAGIKRAEQRNFELEYDTRFEVTRKRLINKAGSKTRKFNHPWARNDVFDETAIKRQADRQIRSEHQKLMSHLENKEFKEVQSLMGACEQRQQTKEKPLKDFARATDRRQGDDRRKADKGPTHRRSLRRIQ